MQNFGNDFQSFSASQLCWHPKQMHNLPLGDARPAIWTGWGAVLLQGLLGAWKPLYGGELLGKGQCDTSSRGKPTATNLTIRPQGKPRRSPLRRGPWWSGSRASESMYSAAVCERHAAVELGLGAPGKGPGRCSLGAAFSRRVLAAWASRSICVRSGTGSLNNWPGP